MILAMIEEADYLHFEIVINKDITSYRFQTILFYTDCSRMKLLQPFDWLSSRNTNWQWPIIVLFVDNFFYFSLVQGQGRKSQCWVASGVNLELEKGQLIVRQGRIQGRQKRINQGDLSINTQYLDWTYSLLNGDLCVTVFYPFCWCFFQKLNW